MADISRRQSGLGWVPLSFGGEWWVFEAVRGEVSASRADEACWAETDGFLPSVHVDASPMRERGDGEIAIGRAERQPAQVVACSRAVRVRFESRRLCSVAAERCERAQGMFLPPR